MAVTIVNRCHDKKMAVVETWPLWRFDLFGSPELSKVKSGKITIFLIRWTTYEFKFPNHFLQIYQQLMERTIINNKNITKLACMVKSGE